MPKLEDDISLTGLIKRVERKLDMQNELLTAIAASVTALVIMTEDAEALKPDARHKVNILVITAMSAITRKKSEDAEG